MFPRAKRRRKIDLGRRSVTEGRRVIVSRLVMRR